MPEFLSDPSVLTKEKLKSELIANNVSLPGGEQRKDVYVQLYLQHLTARNPPAAAAQPDFSSDEEREPTPLGARNRGAAAGRVSNSRSGTPPRPRSLSFPTASGPFSRPNGSVPPSPRLPVAAPAPSRLNLRPGSARPGPRARSVRGGGTGGGRVARRPPRTGRRRAGNRGGRCWAAAGFDSRLGASQPGRGSAIASGV